MSEKQQTVKEIVSEIRKHIYSASKSWREIARLLYVAREQFHSSDADNSQYRSILEKTGFTEKTALKLALVGKALSEGNQRLEHSMFEQVQSWTVLYDSLTLDDEQFEQLVSQTKESKAAPTRAAIKRIKDGPTQPDDYVSVFNVRVDANAIRTGRFDDHLYGEMLQLIRRVQSLAYARVDETTAYSTRSEAWLRAFNDKIRELTDQQSRICLDALSKALDAKDDDYEVKEWLEMSKVDPDFFYDEVRSHCPNLKLRSTAEIAAEARRILDERFMKVAVNDAYQYANDEEEEAA